MTVVDGIGGGTFGGGGGGVLNGFGGGIDTLGLNSNDAYFARTGEDIIENVALEVKGGEDASQSICSK